MDDNKGERSAIEVSREQFFRETAATLARADNAPVVVLGHNGERRMVLSSPQLTENDVTRW